MYTNMDQPVCLPATLPNTHPNIDDGITTMDPVRKNVQPKHQHGPKHPGATPQRLPSTTSARTW